MRPACRNRAVATLTYVYADSTAVVGPLAVMDNPHSWDLCAAHALRITAPQGWELVRHPDIATVPDDDLTALLDAVTGEESADSVDADRLRRLGVADPQEVPATAAGTDAEAADDPEGDTSGAARVTGDRGADAATRGKRSRSHLRIVASNDDVPADGDPDSPGVAGR